MMHSSQGQINTMQPSVDNFMGGEDQMKISNSVGLGKVETEPDIIENSVMTHDQS